MACRVYPQFFESYSPFWLNLLFDTPSMIKSTIKIDRQTAPKWPMGSEKRLPLDFWRSRQLSQNKFIEPSTPSMRKVDDGKKEKKRISFLVATYIIASRPPECQPTGTPHAVPMEDILKTGQIIAIFLSATRFSKNLKKTTFF